MNFKTLTCWLDLVSSRCVYYLRKTPRYNTNYSRVIGKKLNAPPLASGKGNTALAMGFDSRDFYTYLENGIRPNQFSQSKNGVANRNYVPTPDNVLIYQNKEIIGAIGISGARSDLE